MVSRPCVLLFVSVSLFGQQHAKNVILFLGDAGSISTLSAASIHAYKEPRALYIQRMPHIGLSETSSTDSWVTDSAAGMTAIVTGRKTANGVISQAPPPDAKTDGATLKTVLEYAEEHGLSTGVISNMNMADATPRGLLRARQQPQEDGRDLRPDLETALWRRRGYCLRQRPQEDSRIHQRARHRSSQGVGGQRTDLRRLIQCDSRRSQAPGRSRGRR